MGKAKRRRSAGEMQRRSAYDFPADQFGTLYDIELEIQPQAGGGLLGLMELALACAARERQGQRPGILGCNYIIECGDGKARMGDFNIAAIMSPHGPERAVSELSRTFASLGARRYAFYTNIRPETGNVPDIAIAGCEPGKTLGWLFDDASFAAAGSSRPVPKLITPGLVGWFTGLLDNTAQPTPEEWSNKQEARNRRDIGDAAGLLATAKDHIRAVAQTKTANRNALVFDGAWRGKEGIHVVSFDDEIFQGQNILSQPVIIIGTNLGIARARNALLVEEAEVSGGLSTIKQRAQMFKISAMSHGRVLKEAWFEAMRTASGEAVIAMRGNERTDQWWHEANKERPGLSALLHHFVQEQGKEPPDPRELAHGTDVAEMKMRRHGMGFKHSNLA